MSSTLANKARTFLLTFIHNESLNNLKNTPPLKINGLSPSEMLSNFEGIEITINNPIETGFASRSGRMKSSYRNLNNDIIIHSEEEEVDESIIEEDNFFIMKQKTIVSEKKIHKKDNPHDKSPLKKKYHKSKSLSDSGELSTKKNVDYIKHSYALLRRLSNLLKKRNICKSYNKKTTNKHSTQEYLSCRTSNNKSKETQELFQNKKFAPGSPRAISKENEFRINLQKIPTKHKPKEKIKATPNSSIQSTSFSETCESSMCQPKTKIKLKTKHPSHSNLNSSVKTKPSNLTNRKSFVDYSTTLHSKIFAESS